MIAGIVPGMARGAVLFALVTELLVMRQIIGRKALVKADAAVLEKLMGPLIEGLMER